MKITKTKRDIIKIPFDLREFLFDNRLNISMLNDKTGISRYTLHEIKNTNEITAPTLKKLKSFFNHNLEKYIIK